MLHMGKMRRACGAGLMALALLATGAAFAAGSKDPSAKVPALPEPLTKESVRELVSRLSDDEVRKLLLDQLDRAAVAAPANAKGAMGMAGMVEHNAGMMHSRIDELKGALAALPSTLQEVGASSPNPMGLRVC